MKQRTPEEFAKFRAAIFSGIAAGKEVKAIALETGAEETYIYSVLRRSGYEKMLLSPTERYAIDQMRKGKLVVSTTGKRGGK